MMIELRFLAVLTSATETITHKYYNYICIINKITKLQISHQVTSTLYLNDKYLPHHQLPNQNLGLQLHFGKQIVIVQEPVQVPNDIFSFPPIMCVCERNLSLQVYSSEIIKLFMSQISITSFVYFIFRLFLLL